MVLPLTGPISTNDIRFALGIAHQNPMTFAQLWALARNGTLPKNKANAGGPYVLPDDWRGYDTQSVDVTPPSAFTLSPQTSSMFSLSFNWTASTDNVGVIGYRIYRNGALLNTVASDVFSYGDNNLTPGTNYQYYIMAFDQAGNTVNSNTISMNTLADTEPPHTFDVYGGPQYPNKIAFTWALAGDNIGVTGYRIYKNDSLIATVSGTTNNYTDNGLPMGTQYTYRVQAFDAAGNTRNGNSSPILSTTPDTTAPNAFTVTAGVSTTSSNNMSWDLAGDDIGVTKYIIVRDAGGGGITRMEVSGTTNSFTDSGLQPAYLYTYHIEAQDAALNSTSSNTIQMVTKSVGDTTPPPSFTLNPGFDNSSTQNSFSWTIHPDVAEYRIYKNGQYMATRNYPTKSYVDTGCNPSTTYQYYVIALDASSNATQSNTITMTTPAATTTYIALGSNIGTAMEAYNYTDWAQARQTPNNRYNDWVNGAAHAFVYKYQGVADPPKYFIQRGFMGFNCSAITSAITAGVRILTRDSYNPDWTLAESFVVVRLTANFPAGHQWTDADYALSNGGINCSISPVTIPGRNTGYVYFPFNQAAINFIIANSSVSLAIVQYSNDFLNVTPIDNPDDNVAEHLKYFSSQDVDVSLYYTH